MRGWEGRAIGVRMGTKTAPFGTTEGSVIGSALFRNCQACYLAVDASFVLTAFLNEHPEHRNIEPETTMICSRRLRQTEPACPGQDRSMMKLQDFHDVADANDAATLRARLVAFARAMDFPLANVCYVVESNMAFPHVTYIGNRPESFRAASETGIAKSCPVFNRLNKQNIPFFYDQAYYVSTGCGELWEHAAKFGYRTGICVSVNLGNGKKLLLGMDKDRPLPPRDSTRVTQLAHLQLLAAYCSDALTRIVGKGCERDAPELTAREKDVLAWALEGKTAWESGRILAISESAVNKYIQSALRKLDATNKHQAAIKARRLGLIS